ncbi:MAG TPA: hypothetical protein ENN51_07060 [candidate division WOR-3 bacterium]|uniref:Uncharacterized protein n=1 Tax=candidate division WOR-3 bacterium TaxID=2052148 RepID=A0A7V0T724_UNCW3|nr:hypothetical protein [candidate division WOR-3 bacterium]
MMRRILHELGHHLPWTAGGAVLGILLLVPLGRLPESVALRMFELFHPLHVFASAAATAGMYGLYRRDEGRRPPLLPLVLLGYVGAVGIGTLSDSLIPFLGERLVGLHHAHAHIGFIELWYLVNPAALAGIAVAWFRPATKLPHAGHVLLSTVASLAHIGMALDGTLPAVKYVGLFLFLLLAVWLPCTFSDIAFPLLFVRNRRRVSPVSSPPAARPR